VQFILFCFVCLLVKYRLTRQCYVLEGITGLLLCIWRFTIGPQSTISPNIEWNQWDVSPDSFKQSINYYWFTSTILENDQSHIGWSQTNWICREIMSVTPENGPENHFQSAATMVENAWKQLSQSQTVAIHVDITLNTTACLKPPRWKIVTI